MTADKNKIEMKNRYFENKSIIAKCKRLYRYYSNRVKK